MQDLLGLEFEIFEFKKVKTGKMSDKRQVSYRQYFNDAKQSCYINFYKIIADEIIEFNGTNFCIAQNKVTNEWYFLITIDKGLTINLNKNYTRVTSNSLFEIMQNVVKDKRALKSEIILSENISKRGDMLVYKIESFENYLL